MANTFVLPISTQTIALALGETNDSIESVLTNFYSQAEPVVTNITIDDVNPASLPNGLLFRSAKTGKLYQKDSNHQSSLVHGGGFTRNGVGHSVEGSLVQLYSNVALGYYENGEIITVPANNKIYIKVGTNTDQNPTSVRDISIPSALSVGTTELKSDAVTEAKILDGAVTVNKLGSRAVSNLKMAADTISIHEMNESGAGFGDLLRRSAGNTSTQDIVNVHFASNNVRAYTKQQYFKSATLSISSNTTTWNVDNQQVADIFLGDNIVDLTFSNHKAGGAYTLRIRQDASGSRTINWVGDVAKWIGGAEPTLTTTPNAVDIITFTSNGAAMFGVISQDFS